MSYRVLARAYRSATFDEVVGQEAIATTLKNAITSGRIHHGYLFTGTRGVGKTSMARILAKSLNCLTAERPTVTPCLTCGSCVAVATGEDVDVVEIDAASNTGVDNIRELRSNAAFRPARARFKVYIIDEVHMLSSGAFNALLKTLEEPPPHVKFILATTEPQKVPATIQSRCQRFDFRAIDADTIAAHLRAIVDAEKIPAEEAVLRRIARLGNGSMRDALSLLEKVLSYAAGEVTGAIADEVIPPPHDELAAAVIEAAATNDPAQALRALDNALQSGRTIDRFCDHLIEHARTLMVLRVRGAQSELVDVAAQVRPALTERAARFDAPTYVYMITLLEELRRQVKFSGAARALADAAVVRLAMCRQFSDLGEWIARLNDGEQTASVDAAKKKDLTPDTGGGSQAAIRTAVVSQTAVHTAQVDTRPIEPVATPTGRLASPAVLPAESRPVAPARTPALSSADWERAARDPLVQRVKDAVEGTLCEVRSAMLATPTIVPSSDDGPADDAVPETV